MDTRVIVDRIRDGKVTYNIGELVTCFRRNSRGHPKKIKDNVEYKIISKNIEDLIIIDAYHFSDIHKIGNDRIKVHRSYMISKAALRELKINEILR